MTDSEYNSVYVLGAGFSKPMGIPLQGSLLPAVIAAFNEEGYVEQEAGLLRLLEGMPGPPAEATLEDVFTLMDQLTAKSGHVFGCSSVDMHQARRVLVTKIVGLLYKAYNTATVKQRRVYQRFTLRLLYDILNPSNPNIFPAVLSLNWDSVFECELVRCIRECKLHNLVGIDLGCNVEPFLGDHESDELIRYHCPGEKLLPVLKLHGSVNWLQCAECESMFTDLGTTHEDWLKPFLVPSACPRCASRYSLTGDKAPLLDVFMVTPTFLKRFENMYIQMVWAKAWRVLQSAKNIIFVGYSMPQADYHLRALLARSVSKDARISVILSDAKEETAVVERFQKFFGVTRVSARNIGTEGFTKAVFRGHGTIEDALDEIKKMGNKLRSMGKMK